MLVFKQMEGTVITNSVEETATLGRELAKAILSDGLSTRGKVVTLSGELGSGKTSFAQGFAVALGVTEKIKSPTFVIFQTYAINTSQNNFKYFTHIDAYRLEKKEDLEKLGVGGFFSDPEVITILEWPEMVLGITPRDAIEVFIKHLERDEREFIFKNAPSNFSI